MVSKPIVKEHTTLVNNKGEMSGAITDTKKREGNITKRGKRKKETKESTTK